jgi:hypothetical protein
MVFFDIEKMEEGEKFSSNGRVGLDYNRDTDKIYPSYVSVLQRNGMID